MMSRLTQFLIFFIIPNSILSKNCPTIQSVIKLNSSAIASNFSFAIIADGKYYLIGPEDDKNEFWEPTGDMPKRFDESRVTIVIDRLQCNDSQYYLLTLETLRVDESNWVTFYSTLDLLNWNRSSRWSDPKPISEYPMLANDPYLKFLPMIDPNFVISKFVKTIFYSEKMRTIFVVIESIFQSHPTGDGILYYSIDMRNTCEENYSYSKSTKDFELALNRVLYPLDFCFIDDRSNGSNSLLFCISGHSFQVNQINSQLSQDSGLKTKLIGFPDTKQSSDYIFPVFERICKSQKPVQESGIRLRIETKKDRKQSHEKNFENSVSIHTVTNHSSSVTKESVQLKEVELSYTVIIAIICLCLILIMILVVIVLTVRKRNSVSRM